MECSNGGYIWLTHQTGEQIVFKTECKTWGCRPCAVKQTSLVKAMMTCGIYTLGTCWLISATFAVRSGARRDAQSVSKVWKRWLSLLRPLYPNLQWFRIIEMTKKSQPHLHLIMSGLGLPNRRAACEEWPLYDSRWRNRLCRANCIEHELSALWFEASGDSWVVDARAVLGAAGASAYLGKYLSKGLANREELERMGFVRRYSRSRGWPFDRLKLVATLEKKWDTQDWHPKYKYGMIGEGGVERTSNSRLHDRVGTEVAEMLGKRVLRQAGLARIMRLSKDESVQENDVC